MAQHFCSSLLGFGDGYVEIEGVKRVGGVAVAVASDEVARRGSTPLAVLDRNEVLGIVELKDIQLPVGMKRAMAREAEAEREKRAKVIAAQGEAMAADSLAAASDVMMAHPLALQLRNLQTLVELGVDKNSTVVFPAPLMSTITDLGAFLDREARAAATPAEPEHIDLRVGGARSGRAQVCD